MLALLLAAASPLDLEAGGMRYLFVPPRSGARVVVAVPGADGDVPGLMRQFLRHRPDDVGVVVPWARSNRNSLDKVFTLGRALDADEAGLLAVLDDVERRLGRPPRVVLTGFSGGGLIVYRMIARHPGRFAAAVPVCPNFVGLGDPVPGGRLSVHILTGADDPLGTFRVGGWKLAGFVSAMLLLARRRRRRWPVVALALALLANHRGGIDAQASAAEAALRQQGYEVRRETVAGRGHEPMPDRVFGWWRSGPADRLDGRSQRPEAPQLGAVAEVMRGGVMFRSASGWPAEKAWSR